MAISERIKAEALRTIDGMKRFYERYSEESDDAEELEHRIARIETSMEGCNGLTQEEKVQKTAENVFELTCAQERSYDAMRIEMRKSREEWRQDFNNLRSELKSGLDGVMRKIEESGSDSMASIHSSKKHFGRNVMSQAISKHPLLAFNFFMFLLVLVFVSGHFSDIMKLWGGN